MAEFRLDRDGLVSAFFALGRLAWASGKTIEVAVYGGSALMLIYDWRLATKDVDGVYEDDHPTVRKLAAVIAEERGWPDNWLNDGVKGFLSASDREKGVKRLYGEFPSADEPGLRVFVPRPEYLFAMKCRAMRVAGVDHDGGCGRHTQSCARNRFGQRGRSPRSRCFVLSGSTAAAESPFWHRRDIVRSGWR